MYAFKNDISQYIFFLSQFASALILSTSVAADGDGCWPVSYDSSCSVCDDGKAGSAFWEGACVPAPASLTPN